MMKKKLAILAAMMMAATMFASCGDSSSSSKANETTTAPAESAADTSSEAETTTAPEESKPEETTAETTEATTEPEPVEPPENAIGIAGVSFQVKDSWEYRNVAGDKVIQNGVEEPLNVTCTDTYITGNGDYEVTLEGWWCDFDEAVLGWVALDVGLPVEVNDEVATFKDYPDMQIKLTEYQQDGKTIDLSGIDIGLEANNNTDSEGNNKEDGMYKIVNGWNNPAVDNRGEEYGGLTWQSTDPVTIKFTVSGLPNDKGDEEVAFKVVSGDGGEVG